MIHHKCIEAMVCSLEIINDFKMFYCVHVYAFKACLCLFKDLAHLTVLKKKNRANTNRIFGK